MITCETISKTVKENLFETEEELKINLVKELNIKEDDITISQYNNKTNINITKPEATYSTSIEYKEV